MKKRNLFKHIFDAVTEPFTSVSVMIGVSREINEDGSWDKYWEKKNRQGQKGAQK